MEREVELSFDPEAVAFWAKEAQERSERFEKLRALFGPSNPWLTTLEIRRRGTAAGLSIKEINALTTEFCEFDGFSRERVKPELLED